MSDSEKSIDAKFVKIEGKLDLIVYRLDEMAKNEAVTEKNFSQYFDNCYNDKQSTREKVLRLFLWIVVTIITTVITVVTGISDILK